MASKCATAGCQNIVYRHGDQCDFCIENEIDARQVAAVMRWSTDRSAAAKLEKALGEMTTMREENTQLLAENARLRRRLEK